MSLSSYWAGMRAKFIANDYNPLPTQADGSVQVRPHFSQLFQSRRIQFTALACIIPSVLLLTYFFLPVRFLRAAQPLEEEPPGSSFDGSFSPSDGIDWSRFAYVQYATDQLYLCNAVMLFEILHRLQSKPDRLLMYPSTFLIEEGDLASEPDESRLLRRARDEYNVKLQPIEVQHRQVGDPTWAESYTKLLAFNQTQYERVLSLDSDSTVLQAMDELFLIPPSPVAMPRAYWLDPNDRVLSSQLILIQPSEFEYERIAKATREARQGEYDMEIMNNLYRDSCLILPHRPYDLLTGEFRSENHYDYLGNKEAAWDPDAALKEAKFLHFSDWPRPKPWIQASNSQVEDLQPKCSDGSTAINNGTCRERDLWLGFYSDFAKRRQDICGLGAQKTKRGLKMLAPPSRYIYVLENS